MKTSIESTSILALTSIKIAKRFLNSNDMRVPADFIPHMRGLSDSKAVGHGATIRTKHLRGADELPDVPEVELYEQTKVQHVVVVF